MSSSENTQLSVVRKWNEGFEKKDINLLVDPLHKDFTCVQYPRSLGMPDQNKDEWHKHMAAVLSSWDEMKQTVHSVTEAPGKVITHYTGVVKTKFGVEITREGICIATVVADEGGKLKIIKVEEFIDSKEHLDTMQKLAPFIAMAKPGCT